MQRYFHQYTICRIQQYLIVLNYTQSRQEKGCEYEKLHAFLKGVIYGSKSFDLIYYIKKTKEDIFYVDFYKHKSVENLINNEDGDVHEYLGKVDEYGAYDENGNSIERDSFAIQ